jgi:eukaryotic-like serine/threonine-protein kinase
MSVGSQVRLVGRYALHDEIAAGGMATVHFGRLLGQAGFSRTVAIKRLHAQYAKDPEFVAMFMDEARLAARIHHPNVVATLDVVAREGELFLVMEYVPGESLSKLIKYAARQGEPIDPRIAVSIVAGFLHGLHAAHEARNEHGDLLELVHRDVSPQNVLVGVDGVPRVVDFGVAKAIGRSHTTREGQLKGKLAYMSPEQIQGLEVTRRSDVYAASIILWELLTERRLFERETEAAVMLAVLESKVVPPSVYAPGIPERLDRIALRGLANDPDTRFQSAREMALELEEAIGIALPSEIGEWALSVGGAALSARATKVTEIESKSGVDRQLPPSDKPPEFDEMRTVVNLVPAEITTPDGFEKPARRRTGLIVAIGVCIAALLGFSLLFGPSSAPPKDATPAAQTAATTAPTKPAPPPPENVTELELPATEAPPPEAVQVAVPVTDLPLVHEAPRAPVAAPAAPPAHVVKRLPAKCDPPYRIDASGHKIFIMECL